MTKVTRVVAGVVMRRKEISILFILVLLLTTSGSSQEVSRSFSVAKSLPDPDGPTTFEFSTANHNYSISPHGKGLRGSSNETPRSFSLPLHKDDFLTSSLYYAEYQGDLLLIGEVSDTDYGAGFIVRLDKRTLRIKWKQTVSGFNVGQGLIDGSYAYVTGIGSIGKVSLKTGAYIWRHTNLYRQRNSAFNSFELPEVNGNTVVFRESSHYLRKKIAVITVERRTGKIISIVT